MMENEKNIKKLIIVLFGILISIIGAMLWVNGGYEKGGLLQLGEIYSLSDEMLQMGTESCIYDAQSGEFTVQNAEAELYFEVVSTVEEWGYCTIKLGNKSDVPLAGRVDFLDGEGNVIFGRTYTLRRGTNEFRTPIHGRTQGIRIKITNQTGYTFRLDNITLRQKYFNWDDFAKKLVTIFLLCVMIYILVWAGKRCDWYCVIEILQTFYIWLGDGLGSRLARTFTHKMRRQLQMFGFMILFLLMVAMNIVSGQNYNETGQYWLVGFGALWLLIGALSWQKPLQKLNWRNSICMIWLFLWGIVLLSDLLVGKSFSYVGYIMLFCIGFTFFIWHNENSFRRMFFLMLRGLEWTLPIILIYCMLFRNKKIGVYYNGCFPTHESMAMYAVALLIAFLAEVDLLLHQKNKYKIRLIVSGVGTILSIFLLYYSRTIWCIVAAALVIVVWLIRELCSWRQWYKEWKGLFVCGVMIAVVGLGLTLIFKATIQVVPQQMETNLIYDNEVQESMVPEGQMYALEAEQPGWLDGVVLDKEGNKKLIWQQYIQKLNLIGNEDNLREGEMYLNPSNGVIQIAYRYGMFVLIPYGLLLLLCFYRTIRERKFLWLATMLAFLVVMLGENLELPFTQPLWLMLYVELGRWLGNEGYECERECGKEN